MSLNCTALAKSELEALRVKLQAEYDKFAGMKLSLNMARGKPAPEVAADNSPLAAKYAGFAVDYGTVNGTDRIVIEAPAA